MTRNDARMIAQELLPMLMKEIRRIVPTAAVEDEFLNSADAAKLICRSVSFLKSHPEIPSTKVGSRRLYSKKELMKFVMR